MINSNNLITSRIINNLDSKLLSKLWWNKSSSNIMNSRKCFCILFGRTQTNQHVRLIKSFFINFSLLYISSTWKINTYCSFLGIFDVLNYLIERSSNLSFKWESKNSINNEIKILVILRLHLSIGISKFWSCLHKLE